MERLFRTQLEMTSLSLWLMSGILAMLKQDGFQPSDPTLFNSALNFVSASLSQQARSASAGASFIQAKRRESLLTHTSIPVPEAQRRSLTLAPGSGTGLFNEDILSEVVAQVQRSSLISSNLAVSRSFGRGKSRSPPPLRLWILPPRVLLMRAGRPGSALPPPHDPEEVSTLGAARVRLLLPNLWVFGSRSRFLVWPCPAAVCPSIGRPGGTEAWIRGWWRCCGRGTMCLSAVLLHCPWNPSLCLLTTSCPPKGLR